MKAAILIAVLIFTYHYAPLVFVGAAIYALFVFTKSYALRFPFGSAFVFGLLYGLFGGRR